MANPSSPHDPTKTRFLSWIGVNRRAEAMSRGGEKFNTAEALHARESTRRILLDLISDFLIEHKLEISGANLITAHAAITGIDRELVKLIDARMNMHLPVSQDWLDSVTGATAYLGYRDELKELTEKLEHGLSEFAAHSSEAHNATGQYCSELEQHVEALHETDGPSETVMRIADLAAVMLERTWLMEEQMRRSVSEARILRKNLAEARRNADIDHLTGLPNRRAFESLFETEFQEAKASGEELSVAFCDIDHFKIINDTHGHDTGDRVIAVIAEALAGISNERCHVARHGGEEFVMLFRGMSTDDVLAKLNETREHLSQRNFVNRANDIPLGRVTFSGGIANVFAYPEPRAAMKAADAALYQAKAMGRNRILIADNTVID